MKSLVIWSITWDASKLVHPKLEAYIGFITSVLFFILGCLKFMIIVVNFLSTWPNCPFSSYQVPDFNLIVKLIELLEIAVFIISISFADFISWSPLKNTCNCEKINSLVSSCIFSLGSNVSQFNEEAVIGLIICVCCFLAGFKKLIISVVNSLLFVPNCPFSSYQVLASNVNVRINLLCFIDTVVEIFKIWFLFVISYDPVKNLFNLEKINSFDICK